MSAHPSALEKHPRIADLAKNVRARLKIRYVPVTSGWGAGITGGLLKIDYSQSPYPVACLAHELLHAQLQLNGYRRIKTGFTGHPEDYAGFDRFLKALDNELQHHRMFPEFARLGFPPEQFYDHREAGTESFLVNEVLNKPSSNLLSMIPDFLTVLAPGGDLTPESRAALIARFLALNDGRFRKSLSAIQAAIEAWSRAPELNAEPMVRAICQAMHEPCLMWFGYAKSDRPPATGFFAGPAFSIADEI